MTHIFLSYSRKDILFANFIAQQLRARGAEVFIDYQKLEAGNFVQQLGHEIECRDTFLLIVSPHSVKSKWVQAEVSWAFMNDKRFIPLTLQDASYRDIFPVASMEAVDCRRWQIDRKMDDAIAKLARLLGISAAPIQATTPAEALPTPAPDTESATDDPSMRDAFVNADIEELFMKAIELVDSDPDRALYLYEKVLEIDPNHAHGTTRNFVEVEKRRMLPAWLAQAQLFHQQHEWRQVITIADKILEIDEEHAEAKALQAKAESNYPCQDYYERAVIAYQAERMQVAKQLMRYVKRQCPDYGDPERLLKLSNFPEAVGCETVLEEHNDAVLSVAFSPDGHTLASAALDGTVKLWHFSSQPYSATLTGHNDAVRSVAFSPDGHTLASASYDNTIKLWQLSSQQCVVTLTGHNNAVVSVAFSPDGQTLASAAGDHTVKLWQLSSQQCTATLTGHTSDVWSVAFSPDGQTLASASYDRTVKLWQLSSQQCAATLTGHDYPVKSLAFSPDGHTLASASYDRTVKLWHLSNQQCSATLIGHNHSVMSIAFSPDGQMLASASLDKTVKLWNLSSQQCTATLTGHNNAVNSLAFSPDGMWLASGSDDETIRLWRVLF